MATAQGDVQQGVISLGLANFNITTVAIDYLLEIRAFGALGDNSCLNPIEPPCKSNLEGILEFERCREYTDEICVSNSTDPRLNTKLCSRSEIGGETPSGLRRSTHITKRCLRPSLSSLTINSLGLIQ